LPSARASCHAARLIVGGAVNFDETTANLLLDHLPATVRICADSKPAAALRPLLELLGEEFAHAEPGAANVRDQLTKVLFVQALRAMIASDNRPLDYLAHWRIQAAGRTLRSTDRTVFSVATEFGYGSESAFSNAFKRVTGQSPAKFRVH